MKTNKKTKSNKKEKEIEAIEESIEDNIEKAEEVEDKKEHPSQKQIASESKILLITLVIIGLLVGVFIFILLLSNTSKSFTVDGVRYIVDTTIEQGQTLYDTKIPMTLSNGSNAEYNIYLNYDPRMLDKEVPFNGSLYVRQNLVINSSSNLSELNCNGDGILGVANLVNLYQNALGINVTKSSNMTCDPQIRYVYLNIVPSNETNIQEIAPGCYNINVNNCQILAATERYMTETFSTLNQAFNVS
ncbi:MAG: hypothetical protein WAU65_01830 [Candidatus Nanoarchaeia archaeon]